MPAVATYRVPAPHEQRRGGFAFMIHPTDEDVLFNTLPSNFADLDLAKKTSWRAWMASWFTRMYEPSAVYHLPAMRSHAGGYVEGWLVAAPLTPLRLMRLRKEEKKALLDAYIDAAREHNVDIIGLGAFTSVIARGGDDLADAGVNITSGNSLTAIASVESLRSVAASYGRDLVTETVAVIGAAGSIGRLTALHLGRYSRQLILFGNPKNPHALANLLDVAGAVYRTAAHCALDEASMGIPELLIDAIGPDTLDGLLATIPESDPARFKLEIEALLTRAGMAVPILVSDDLTRDLGKAGCVLSASAAGKSFIDPQLFAPGSIVCDVARPLDVLGSVQAARPDVFVYEGGVMQLPEDISFGVQNILGYPRGYNLACLSETMVLAMEGAQRSYSIGSKIDYPEALDIYAKSRLHGFKFAVLVDGVRRPAEPFSVTRQGQFEPVRAGDAASVALCTTD